MKIRLKQRSLCKELLDGEHIPFADIALNMTELDVINSRLGGHAITLAGVKKLLAGHQLYGRKIKIVEIGCGGGDNLRAIKKWASKNKIDVQLTGVDINRECIEYAKSRKENQGIQFLESEYSRMIFAEPPAIVFNSLFCHHFNYNELVYMMRWMRRTCTLGFFINDLDRNIFAYYSIKVLTKAFSKSYLVKNDAPLSVLRGFRKEDFRHIMKEAGIENYSIEWKWAFRWLVTYHHA